MDSNALEISRIHPEYQPEEKLPLAQFNLFTGEPEPVVLLVDNEVEDDVFIDEGISLIKSGDSSQVVLSGFGIFLSKKIERLIVKKSNKVIYEFPFFRLNEVIVVSRGISLSSDLIEELLIKTSDYYVPVDFKYTSSQPHENHPYQLLGYAIILEDIYGCSADRGFVYLIPKEDAVIFNLTGDLKTKTKILLEEIRDMLSSQQMPLPAKSRSKCSDCEYRNFCGDIF